MAANFRVVVHRNSDSLHLRLEGNFDGNSAQQVLHMLAESGFGAKRIFIHTNGIREIDPFGKAIFQENLNTSKKNLAELIFTGDKGPEIAPKGHRLMA
jgi:hypothetical protein